MSKEEAKKLAEKFIQEQERIIEEYGDSVVKSKRKDAIASVQQIFEAIASRPVVTTTKNDSHAKS
jgi:vacuolar-type H+-ATPase subunit H